jgi:fluoroacetyl-CoA thioesterase
MSGPLENVRVGMTGRKEVVVTRELTVGAHVEGMPFVYGTPFMILAMEIASGEAVKAHLPPGWATVGSAINVRHLAPTPMGRTIVATARVIEVSERSIMFAVEAHDGTRMIGEGTHRRGAVNLESFAKRPDAG